MTKKERTKLDFVLFGVFFLSAVSQPWHIPVELVDKIMAVSAGLISCGYAVRYLYLSFTESEP